MNTAPMGDLKEVAIATIPEISGYVTIIVSSISEPNNHTSMVKTSVCRVIEDSMVYGIPVSMLSSTLVFKLLDDYRICTSLNKTESNIVNTALLSILDVIRSKLDMLLSLSNIAHSNYSHVTYNIDLNNLNIIEVKLYQGE
jgi:hypothetical protein